MLKKAASFVLASFRSSTGTRPPHHSAARTDVVLLIRRTVRPRGYASGLHSLRPCRTVFLSILRGVFLLSPTYRPIKFRCAHSALLQNATARAPCLGGSRVERDVRLHCAVRAEFRFLVVHRAATQANSFG